MRWTALAGLGAMFLSMGGARAEPARHEAEVPAPTTAQAADPPIPHRRFVLNNLTAFRYNPLGFEDQARIGFQQKLHESDKSRFLRDNFFFGGAALRVNPAFAKIGPSIELQPLSVFNVRLTAEYIGYFSTFGFLQSFQSPLDEYSDSVLKKGKDAKRNYPANGLHVMIEPMIQFKWTKLLLRDKLSIEHWRVKLENGDRVFYDVTLDTLIGSVGWVIQNDADLLYLHDFIGKRKARLAAGVRYTYVRPFYDKDDFARGEDRSSVTNEHHRVGPLLAYTFFDDGYSRFNKPTAILIANWYLSHRYRTGADVSGALPYLILGFSFQSDLLD